jgi:AraC-like DNA-binding protein
LDTNPQLALNLMLRGGAMLLLGVVAAALLRDYGRIAAARLGAAFALGTAAFALNSAPGFANHAAWWQAPVVALNAGNMCMFWLFARALLDDAFVLRASHLALWSAFAIAGVLNCFVFAPLKLWIAVPTGIALTLATAVFAVSAVARSLSTWRDDLVEGRRRMRMMLVGAAAAYGILLTLVALMHGYDVRPAFSGSANAFGLALLSALIAWRLMFVAGDTLFPLPPSSASAVPARAATTVAAPPEPALIGALERLMTTERLYRDESLTIAALSLRMGLPEYKLRRLINQGMGHRNFNAFLNAYRIDDARYALADPGQADVPVLTIAMDAGFGSLGPFNRAFKAVTGLTPTEFRRMNTATPG